MPTLQSQTQRTEKEVVMGWEDVTHGGNEQTLKLKVKGGELYYRKEYQGNTKIGCAMAFVPDIDLQRYQAHLRDAYKKGYEDGQHDAKRGIDHSEDIKKFLDSKK